jgi:predicted ester cyclase
LKYRVIADCAVKENKIVEEWLVRDDLSIIRQMGLDEQEFVAKLVGLTSENFSGVNAEHAADAKAPTQSLPPIEEGGVESFIKRVWHNAWNLRMFDSFVDAYISTIQCHSASGRELFGHEDLIQFAIDWLACFPDGQMRFDHFCALGDDDSGYRTSLRWTFTGTHTGYGIYGKPSGKTVKIMGITQAHVQGGKILEEWTVFDELNLLCQLFVPTKISDAGKDTHL